MRRLAAALLLLAGTTPLLAADDLASKIEALAKPYEATVGVSAIDTMNGRQVSVRGGEKFPMGSVYKFPITLALLRSTSLRQRSLDDQVTIEPKDFAPGHSPIADEADGKAVTLPLGTLVIEALRDSDNTASDALLRVLGGPAAVDQYLNFVGVRGIDVSRSEKEIAADIAKQGESGWQKDPRDTSSPDAMVLLLRMFNEKAHGLTAINQTFVNQMMEHSTTGAERIRAGAPKDWTVMNKSGTMPGVVNDVAILKEPDERHRVVIAVFTKGWKSTPDAKREQLIADITRVVCEEFTKP